MPVPKCAQGCEATGARELFVARSRRLRDGQLLRELELMPLAPEGGEAESHDEEAAHDDARDEAALDAELAIALARGAGEDDDVRARAGDVRNTRDGGAGG